MFTGLVEELGSIKSRDDSGNGCSIVIGASVVTSDSHNGDSIAVNGVCLTALDVTPNSFAADVSPETLDRTTLGRLEIDSPVNLERAATPATRLGGHIVQGHVDGRGTFVAAVQQGDFWTVTVTFPPELARYFVEKGSVAVEGISLTIAALREHEFDFAIIPKTWNATNLHSLMSGDLVNLEVDMVAKYVERLVSTRIAIDRLPERQ
jgi:riboflavin synthase